MKIFISGSCVTRDAFSLLPTQFVLEEYVARYSVARIPYQAIQNKNFIIALASNFQKKLVENDIYNRLIGIIKKTDFDFFIMDFIDERFGLVQFEDTYVTASSEFMNSGGK